MRIWKETTGCDAIFLLVGNGIGKPQCPLLTNMDISGIFEIMNISFTDQQEKYINSQLESGDLKNASEVVRDALRLHQVYRHRVIEDLRAEIAKGWEGTASKRTASQIARDKKRLLEH